MLALIDGDLVAYPCAASAEAEPVEIACMRAKNLLEEILTNTKAEEYRCFLSGGENFRKKIDPLYKANRKEEDPIHLQAVREFLVLDYKAEVTDGIEADDALGIHQREYSVICSYDKDLIQLPGLHFRWARKGKNWERPAEFIHQTYIGGLRHFYEMSLIGDKADNIVGVHNIGKVKAAKLLEGYETEQEMFDVCRSLYNGEDERFFKNLKLLWILREPDGVFNAEERGLI